MILETFFDIENGKPDSRYWCSVCETIISNYMERGFVIDKFKEEWEEISTWNLR